MEEDRCMKARRLEEADRLERERLERATEQAWREEVEEEVRREEEAKAVNEMKESLKKEMTPGVFRKYP